MNVSYFALYIFSCIVGNKAKEWISEQVFQQNKARQIFRKTNISYPLIRTRTTSEIRPFGLLLTIFAIPKMMAMNDK